MDAKQAEQMEELLDNPRAEFAQKALDYFDGDQEKQLIKVLDDVQKGRSKWREKGLIPRYRNVVRMIVEKSGMLFNNSLPIFEVYEEDRDVVDMNMTTTLNEQLDELEIQEFLINLDHVVRLLKTAIVLVQWDNESDQFILDILHRGNCEVIINPINKKVMSLVYETYEVGETCGYRVYTTDSIIDLEETQDQVSILGIQPNLLGMIPIAQFYDTNTPRSGFWVEAPSDLVNMNEMFNLHLTDSEYVASWAKLKTLFITNARIDNQGVEQYEVQFAPGQALPHMAPAQASVMGGPNKIVFLNSTGNGEPPSVDYKGPDIDLGPIDEMFNSWIRDFAQDWSVRIKAAGEGQAQSGFQLVVEEMDNLELRKKRQRMFEAGFARLYRVMAKVMNLVHPGTFTETSELFVTFNNPSLPVNEKESEEVWTMRIDSGRATRVDYFMAMQGMTKEQAQEKVLEIDQGLTEVQADIVLGDTDTTELSEP